MDTLTNLYKKYLHFQRQGWSINDSAKKAAEVLRYDSYLYKDQDEFIAYTFYEEYVLFFESGIIYQNINNS